MALILSGCFVRWGWGGEVDVKEWILGAATLPYMNGNGGTRNMGQAWQGYSDSDCRWEAGVDGSCDEGGSTR